MKKNFSAAVVAFGLMVSAFAAPAAAQREGGWEAMPPSRAQRALHDFASCVAQGESREARDVLAMDYRTPAYDQALRRLLGHGGTCMGVARMGANRRFFAARIAEALLLRDLRGTDLAARVAYDPARPAIQARSQTELMAFCTVRAAPAQVAALFATRPATPHEAAALSALMPQMSQCLTAGASGRFNRAALRSILDLAAYRLSEYNRSEQSASLVR
jgi:hypothetical protein